MEKKRWKTTINNHWKEHRDQLKKLVSPVTDDCGIVNRDTFTVVPSTINDNVKYARWQHLFRVKASTLFPLQK